MGVQQLIANNTNVLIDASVIASTVTPSASITRTGMTRGGTGLVELSGLYTGHTSADYVIEIITGEGNGRASSPVFSGVGSGTLSVTAAGIPAQDVTVTLLTPPYPGATAEARVGSDIIKAVTVGDSGNLINLQVDRSGLSFTASGSSTLELIDEGSDELTNYKWDIPGVICSADLKGNVPADAPRIRFGSDPTIYRIIKDTRSGSLKTILSPAAVRPVPVGSVIWLASGTYSVTVTDGTDTETYTGITTGYDLLSQLLSSTIVQPAYVPAPVMMPGGNAAVDLPLVTGSTALLTDSSSPAVRPSEIIARSTAFADTIRMQSRGNGVWGVTASSGSVYPDAFEGQVYAPAASPVLLTIPSKPAPLTAITTQPVFLADQSFVTREAENATLPLLCIDGALGINASPKSITATYAKRPSLADCPCPTDTGYWSMSCLGLTNSVVGEDSMSLDPAYQSRLETLFSWQKTAVEANSAHGTSWDALTATQTTYYCPPFPKRTGTLTTYWSNNTEWSATTSHASTHDTLGTYAEPIPSAQVSTALRAAYGIAPSTEVWYCSVWVEATRTQSDWSTTSPADSEYTDKGTLGTQETPIPAADVLNKLREAYGYNTSPEGSWVAKVWSVSTSTSSGANPQDIAFINSVAKIMSETLSQVWSDAAGSAKWDLLMTQISTETTALASRATDTTGSTYATWLARYQAGCEYVLAFAGIVPGKSDTANGSTGCWQDNDADYWWILSDGYAPAFTGVEYYSTRAGSFENSQEFGFMIKCGCPEKLMEGDTLTIQIGAGLAASVWSSNEFLEITTIPTTPLYLAGGKDADDTETWSVTAKDSSNAALPAFVADTATRDYSSGGLAFTLTAGGIPYNAGDRFSFTVEGGTFKWRKNSGSWSSATAIADGTLLDSGLSVDFISGLSPSFVAADSYSFTATQTNAATGLQTPNAAAWSWSGATATITFTLPEERSVGSLSLLHSLPAGAAIAVDYSIDGTTFLPLAWASGVVRDYLHVTSGTPVDAIGLRITVDHPGAIRWMWAGVPLQPELSAQLRLLKKFDMARAKESGSSVMLAQGTAASLQWDVMHEDDALSLAEMISYVKENGDEPIVLIPQYLHNDEAVITRVADDGFELVDMMSYQPDDTSKRIYSCSMELTPEWR